MDALNNKSRDAHRSYAMSDDRKADALIFSVLTQDDVAIVPTRAAPWRTKGILSQPTSPPALCAERQVRQPSGVRR